MALNNGPVTVTLQYDGDGNRVAKTVGGVTTRYLVDDLNPTGYAQVVEELTSTSVTRIYTYGRQRINQNQLIGSAWTPSFYGYDGFGSVRQLTSSAGTVTDTYDYDAWGNSVNTTGTTPNAYLYRGEQYDSDLNLYYLRARYFNPLSGRFLTKDTDEGDPAAPETLHRYVYAGSEPVDHLDPTGHNSITQSLLKIGAWVAGTVMALGETVRLTWCKIWGWNKLAVDADVDSFYGPKRTKKPQPDPGMDKFCRWVNLLF
jgi:RHS repeat-associated protein